MRRSHGGLFVDHMPVGDDDPACIDDRAGTDDVDDVRRVGDVLARLAAIGALTFRYGLRGSYFALVTLAFAEVFRILANSWSVTGGGFGLLGNIVLGIIGAVVAGWLLPALGVHRLQQYDRDAQRQSHAPRYRHDPPGQVHDRISSSADSLT